MKRRIPALLAMSLLLATFGLAKDKAKGTLPTYLLNARTVLVLIDPEAGVSLDDPKANEVARKDVETALLNWGRLQPVMSAQAADLIIVVRRGHGRMVSRTVTDPRQNGHPGTVNPYDSGISIGAQHGKQSNPVDAQNPGATQDSPHSQTEIGEANDSFSVYAGGVDDPLDSNPAWKYVAKDALHPHTVPAVAEFRKALAEADKQASAKKP